MGHRRVKQGCGEGAGKHTLEVQVCAHGIRVTGRWPVQAAVHGRLGFQQTLQSIAHVAGMAHTAPCVLGQESRWAPFRAWGSQNRLPHLRPVAWRPLLTGPVFRQSACSLQPPRWPSSQGLRARQLQPSPS